MQKGPSPYLGKLSVSSLIIQNKLRVPQSENWLPRPDLFERLDAPEAQNVLVQASAGYGKTSLVASWLSHSASAVAWLSLDEYDNQVQNFWRYGVASLQRLHEGLGTAALSRLKHGLQTDPMDVVDSLLDDLNQFTRHRLRPGQCVWVLDDAHVLTDEALLSSLGRFLDYKPYWLKVVLTSRTRLPLHWAHRVSRQQAVMIQQDQLAFDEGLIRQTFSTSLPINDQCVQLIADKTHGWPAAIQLMLPHLRGRSLEQCEHWLQQAQFEQDELLADYLHQEMWGQLSISSRDVLLTMAAFDGIVSHGLLTHIHGENKNDIQTLQEESLLTQRKDDVGISYVIHPLFAQWVVNEAAQHHSEVLRERRQQCLAAAQKLGHTLAALRLSIRLQIWPVAAQVFGQLYEEWFKQGDMQALSDYLSRFPIEVQNRFPLLTLLQAHLAFMSHQTDQLTTHLQNTKSLLSQYEDHKQLSQDEMTLLGLTDAIQWRQLKEGLYLLTAIASLFNGWQEQQRAAAERIADLSEHHPLRAWWFYYQTVDAFSQDDLAKALKMGLESLSYAWQHGDIYCVLATLPWAAYAQYHMGETRRALNLVEHHWQRLEQDGYRPSGIWVGSVGAAAIFNMELQQDQQAWHYLVQIETIGSKWAEPREWLYNYFQLRAQWHMSRKEFDDAEDWLNKASQYEDRLHRELGQEACLILPSTEVYRLWLSLSRGDVFAIMQWAMSQEWDEERVPMATYLPNFLLTMGRMMMGQGFEEWERLFEAAQSSGYVLRQVGLLMLKASFTERSGESEDAFELAQQAIELAHRGDYQRTVLNGPPGMVEWLPRWQANKGTTWPQIDPPSPQMADVDPMPQADKANVAAPVEALTQREEDILKHLALGLSNQAIADELGIALSTVKRHVQNIYGKLQVNSRTQAILAYQVERTPQ